MSAPPHLIPAGRQPSKLVKMTPLHQMPAADPETERLDETQEKTIQTKANSKLEPAMPVRTRTHRRAQSLAALARSMNATDSPTATSLIAQQPPRTKTIHHHVQTNDVPQSEPAGQEQMASVQQAHRLGPLPSPDSLEPYT